MKTLLAFLILFVLLSVDVYSTNGVCFDPAGGVGSCEVKDDTTCFISEEMQFFPGIFDVNAVAQCKMGCCCESKRLGNTVWITQGVCNNIPNGVFRQYVAQNDCDQVCSQTIEPCNGDCTVENSADCTGKNGRTVDVETEGGYYCWDADTASTTPQTCNNLCTPLPQCEGQITARCMCGGNPKDAGSGYCCSDVFSTGPCPTVDLCTSSGGTCCNACDGSAIPEANFDGSANKCQSNLPFCCTKCATNYTNCCTETWECKSSDVLPFTYSTCRGQTYNEIPCNVSCQIQECAVGVKITDPINSAPKCTCAGIPLCTGTDPSVCNVAANGYCCASGLSEFPCSVTRFTVSGRVLNITDITESNSIGGATVILESNVESRVTYSDTDGSYSFTGVIVGNKKFKLTAVKENFDRYEIEIVFPSGPILDNQNIYMTPYVSECGNMGAVLNLRANAIKGRKEVNVTWDAPLDSTSLVGYKVMRNELFVTGMLFTRERYFVDYSTEWNKSYMYNVSAIYYSGGSSREVYSIISTGDSECAFRFNSNSFCLGTYKASCNENNNMQKNPCASPCREVLGVAQCAINATPSCAQSTNGMQTSLPFGLFCSEGRCFDSNDWCYYDYSFTTIDFAYPCNISDCYSYNSKDACLADKCGASGMHISESANACEWVYTYGDFGKGICYDKDYQGTDHCGMCTQSAGIFFNLGCDQNMCSKLGSCFSNSTSCKSCQVDMTCEKYNNEQSCINAHGLNRGFSKTGCNEMTRSDDACGLGVCKWGDPSHVGISSCYKDADDNRERDCGGDGCVNILPIETTAVGQGSKIINPKKNLVLSLKTNYKPSTESRVDEQFYFCIDQNNSCCPTQTTSIFDSKVSIDVISEASITEPGTYYLRYFTTDGYRNRESTKSTEFYADPKGPEFNVSHKVIPESGNYTIEVEIKSNECISCKFVTNLISMPDPTGIFSDKIYLKYKNLSEGTYVVGINCSDKSGNNAYLDYHFDVDLVHDITLGYPQFQRLPTSEVKFRLTTSSLSNCVLSTSQLSSPYHPLPVQYALMNRTEVVKNVLYNHSASFNLIPNASYIVDVNCTPLLYGAPDFANYYFSIDNQPPQTRTEPALSGDMYLKPDISGLATIKFICTDPELLVFPHQAGCNGTYLCTSGTTPSTCSPTTKLSGDSYITGVNGEYITFYSVDNLSNKENAQLKVIRIDGTKPTVKIDNKSIGSTTNSKNKDIHVFANDNILNGIKTVKITVRSYAGNNYTYTASKIGVDAGVDIYNAHVFFFEGENGLSAEACDNAGNCAIDSKVIYLDIHPPSIGDISVTDLDSDIDENNILEYRWGTHVSVDIKDNYTHIEGYSRDGVGVDRAEIQISDAISIRMWAKMNRSGDTFYYDVDSIYPPGPYYIAITAYDLYGNYSTRLARFSITDTLRPTLNITPGTFGTVKYLDYNLTGFTDPGVAINVQVRDSGSQERIFNGIGAPMSSSTSFINVPLNLSLVLPQLRWPIVGDTAVYFQGNYLGDISKGQYITFSKDPSHKRYNITGVTFTGVKTKVSLSSPLKIDLDNSLATVYDKYEPSGWFSVPIRLYEGINQVTVIAQDFTGPSADYTDVIIYDPSLLDLEPPVCTIVNPAGMITSQIHSTIGIIATDDYSGISHVNISVKSYSGEVVSYTTLQQTATYFEGEVILNLGLNNITAIACDNENKCNSTQATIYLDTLAPYIGEISIDDNDQDVDVDHTYEYLANLTFQVLIKDNYTMPEGYSFDGIGVNRTLISITGPQTINGVMVYVGSDIYQFNTTRPLDVGRYTVTIGAYDNYEVYSSKQLTFDIKDSFAPGLNVTDGTFGTKYYQYYNVTGFTEADVDITVDVYNWNGTKLRYLGVGATLSKPTDFEEVLVGYTPTETALRPAQPGDRYIYFDGDYRSLLVTGQYIAFSTGGKRYQIMSAPEYTLLKTKVELRTPLEENLDGATATVCNSQYPTGWFSVQVQLSTGLNLVNVSAKAPTGPSASIVGNIIYNWTGYDTDYPSLDILSNDILANQNSVINVNAKDSTSGIKNVTGIVKSYLGSESAFNGQAAGIDNYQASVALYSGLNNLTAVACDLVGNCNSSSKQIYVDIYSPYIGEISIIDSDGDEDTGNIFEYLTNLTFTVNISDRYTHPEGYTRNGIGVNRTAITIIGAGKTFLGVLNNTQNDEYQYTSIAPLSIGTYSVKIESYDSYGKYSFKESSFAIASSKQATLTITDGTFGTSYTKYYNISGFTDPDVQIKIEIFDNQSRVTVFLGQGAPLSLPTDFVDVGVNLTPNNPQRYPEAEDTEIFFDGDYRTKLFANQYLKFSNSERRYRIQKVEQFGFKTKVILTAPLDQGLYEQTATAYNEAFAGGWFNIPVVLSKGQNMVKATAIPTLGLSKTVTGFIPYESSLLNLRIVSPIKGEKLFYPDVWPGPKPIVITASTDYGAVCNITNDVETRVAKKFSYQMASTDGKEHTFTLDSAQCYPSGSFCYIQNDAESGIVYHKYTIKCSAIITQMAPDQDSACFGVATYREFSGQKEGENVCSESKSSCSGSFVAACSGGIPNCVIGQAIPSKCLCQGQERTAGYCCASGYSTTQCGSQPPTPPTPPDVEVIGEQGTVIV